MDYEVVRTDFGVKCWLKKKIKPWSGSNGTKPAFAALGARLSGKLPLQLPRVSISLPRAGLIKALGRLWMLQN